MFTRYPVPDADAGSRPLEITAGPDGNMWFTIASGQVGRLRVGGAPDPDPVNPAPLPTTPPSPSPTPTTPDSPGSPVPGGSTSPPAAAGAGLVPVPTAHSLDELLATVTSQSGLSVRATSGPDDSTPATQAAQQATQVRAGDAVTISGDGFGPDQELGITLFSEPRGLGSATSDARGAFETTVAVPLDIPSGHHTLVVTGIGPDGARHASVTEMVVLGPDSAASDPGWLAGGAITCVVAAAMGTGLVAWRRRTAT